MAPPAIRSTIAINVLSVIRAISHSYRSLSGPSPASLSTATMRLPYTELTKVVPMHLVKTPDLDFILQPIHHNRKTHSLVQKSNFSLSFCLPEIQNVGTRGGSTPNPSTSLFRTDIPINCPLKPLLEASLN